MKLNCNVHVVYRANLTTANTRTRPQNSSLSLVLNPKDNKEVFLIYQTAKTNGVKYKITGNIENVFTKFLSSGKATIRLKVPAIDLCIECDCIQLKCFLQKLKAVLQGQDAKSLKLMTISSSTQVRQKLSTKLIINKKENYDRLCQFPRTLHTVQMNNIMFSTVDSRILKLCNLRTLNLEKNSIEYLPEGIGRLRIVELYLGSNALGGCVNMSYWKWMNGPQIQDSLKLLSLENNQLQFIPSSIAKLCQLVTLKLDNNLLKELPVTIGRLSKLSFFSVSYNKLCWFPATVRSLRLCHFDYSHNKFSKTAAISGPIGKKDFCFVPTLRERAALVVRIHGLQCSISEGDIPVTLQEFLINTSECCCRRPTFCSMPFGYDDFSPRSHFASVVTVASEESSRIKIHYCRYECFRRSVFQGYQS